MIKISEAFRNKKAFAVCLTAGDPDLKTFADYVITAQEAGADLIEIGIPFSDPVSGDKAILASNARALNSGTRLDGIFDTAASIMGKMRVPMVFMSYYNPMFVYGCDRFFSRCADSCVCGVIIPDMPFEEREEVIPAARKYGVELVAQAVLSSKARTAEIAKKAEGFILFELPTDTESDVTADFSSVVAGIRKITGVPVAVKLGDESPKELKSYADIADCIIAGNAIARITEQYGKAGKKEIYEYIKSMKNAMK